MTTGETPDYSAFLPGPDGTAYDLETGLYWHMGEIRKPARAGFGSSSSDHDMVFKDVEHEGEPLSAEELQAMIDNIRDLAGEEIVKRIMDQASEEM